MWLIDFNNVAIEKIQPDTKPSICAYYAHTCIMRVSVCLSLCVLLGPYNNLFLYLFGKLRRNCPNTSVLRPGKPLNFLEEPHSHTHITYMYMCKIYIHTVTLMFSLLSSFALAQEISRNYFNKKLQN